MGNNRVIMITSCKGGVGKSTVAANLGLKLAENGLKTLLLDCDFGVRSLDLILGLEDSIIYDISDIILHDIEPEKAIIADSGKENLYFCAAPYDYNDDIGAKAFEEKIGLIKERLGFDYIIIDTPGDIGLPFRLAAGVSDTALVVSTPQPAAIRAAERTGMQLDSLGVSAKRLVVNCFDYENLAPEDQPDLLEMIDKTCLQLIGVIPYDTELQVLQARGEGIVSVKYSNAAVSFSNIAERLEGKNIPLFTGFTGISRKKLLKLLNGR